MALDWTDRGGQKTFHHQFGAPKAFLAMRPEPCPRWLQQRRPRMADGCFLAQLSGLRSSTAIQAHHQVSARLPKHPGFTDLCCWEPKSVCPSTAFPRLRQVPCPCKWNGMHLNVLPISVPYTFWRTSDDLEILP